MTEKLVIDALDMAIEARRPSAGLLHHSNRGSMTAISTSRSSKNTACSAV